MPAVSIMIKPVSGLCNMRCSYCFYADEVAQRDQGVFPRMDGETLEILMRRIFAYADGGVYIAYQGGEPTLAGADFFREALQLERKYNSRSIPVQHALQTNGLCISDDLISVLQQGKFLVGLSMDGTAALHDARRLDASGRGTYDRVQQTARRLREAGVDYNVLCVVDRAVAQHPREVFRALAPHGYLQFIPCLDPLSGETSTDSLTAEDFGTFLTETFDLYLQQLHRGRYVSVRAFDNWIGMLQGRPPENCGFAGCCAPNFLVESNGNVYPCDFYALDEWLLGNIRTTPFNRLAASERMHAFLESSRQIPDACRECACYALCRGGCRRDRLPNGPNRLCAAYKRFFERIIKESRPR